jgi:hypothetical protein
MNKLFEKILKESKEKNLAIIINLAIKDWFVENHPKISPNKAKILINNAFNKINLSWLEDYYSNTGLGYMGKTYAWV